ILFNLLSNAFKFTLENGTVSVNLEFLRESSNSYLQIEVKDSGIGIPEDKLEKIFEPFFQNDLPRSIMNQGSGIGLSITNEFVKIHGGRITVSSAVGKGSCFTVLLPVDVITGQITEPIDIPDAQAKGGYFTQGLETEEVTDTPDRQRGKA